MKILKVTALASAFFAATLGWATAYQGSELAKYAHITLQQAGNIAVHAVPGGKITDQELEREAGGSVDAKTGRVLENKLEGKNPD